MIWWYLWIPLIGLVTFAGGCVLFFESSSGYGGGPGEFFGIVFAGLAALLLFAALMVNVIVWPSRASGRHACRSFGSQSGYETKFVLRGFAATGSCMVRTNDGHWVDKGNLQIVGGKVVVSG